MTQPLILITGATGTVGTETIKQLTEAGHRVRALVRDRSKAAKLDPRAEILAGDLADPSTLAPAFAGVERVFVITNGLDLNVLEANAFEAAKQAGVRHIVKLSGRGVDLPGFANTALAEWHGVSEKRLRGLGLAWTILRPGFFASNTLVFGVMQNGGYFLPVGDGKDAPIDPADIATVAVKALTESGHEGRIYELSGPELLSFQQMIDKLAAFTGAKLAFVDTPAEAALDGLIKGGVPPKQAEALLVYFSLIKAGRMTVEPATAEVLGRPARRFDDWIAANAAALRS
jgi:uncharacterized protein YbjT (DUF2867 family)